MIRSYCDSPSQVNPPYWQETVNQSLKQVTGGTGDSLRLLSIFLHFQRTLLRFHKNNLHQATSYQASKVPPLQTATKSTTSCGDNAKLFYIMLSCPLVAKVVVNWEASSCYQAYVLFLNNIYTETCKVFQGDSCITCGVYMLDIVGGFYGAGVANSAEGS